MKVRPRTKSGKNRACQHLSPQSEESAKAYVSIWA